MGGNGTGMIDDALTIEEVAFDRDLHAYYEGGRRCMSVTQALNISRPRRLPARPARDPRGGAVPR